MVLTATLQKCDLTKPGCHRCTKYGVTCPGYREQEGLIFRNKDSGHFSQQRARKSSASPFCTTPGGNDGDKAQQSLVLAGPSLVSADPSDQAISLLLSRFQSGVAPCCPFSFFPVLYREVSSDSCLVVVTCALSNAYITSQRGGMLPGDGYGRALRSVNGALGHTTESRSDATAIAVWLLNVYEVICLGASRI